MKLVKKVFVPVLAALLVLGCSGKSGPSADEKAGGFEVKGANKLGTTAVLAEVTGLDLGSLFNKIPGGLPSSVSGPVMDFISKAADVTPLMAKLGVDFPADKNWSGYDKLDNPKYDSFFHDVAVMQGSLNMSNYLLEQVMIKVHQFANEVGASGALTDSQKALLAGRTVDQLSYEELGAFLANAKLAGDMNARKGELLKGITFSSAIAIACGVNAVAKAKDMAQKGKDLGASAKSDFKGLAAVKGAKAVAGAAGNLKGVAETAPKVLENAVALFGSVKQ